MQIFVGNLPLEYTDADLRSMFEAFGTVRTATIGVNRKTGAPEGYGIVEMPVKHEAREAVKSLRGKDMNGNPLRVRILKPDDPFHSSNLQKAQGLRGGGQFHGDIPYRGSGAIRRGGQRGT
jgi:RNA recognition motif-containing protein